MISDRSSQPGPSNISSHKTNTAILETLFDDECFSEIETKPLVNIQEGLDAAATNELHKPSAPTSAADNNNHELLEANGKLMAKSMVLRAKTAQLKLHQRPYHKKLLKTDQDASFYTGVPKVKIFELLAELYSQFHVVKKTKPVTHITQLKYKRFQNLRKNTHVKLCNEDRLLLVLMRLRLGLLRKDLADR